jgi:hypothetical protein
MATISAREQRWRDWVLGEGEFAGKGPRSKPRPDLGIGEKGQAPVPRAWWARLAETVTQREKGAEPAPVAPKANDPFKRPGQLTPHFNVREFDCHDGRKVPAAAVPALTRLCQEFLEPLRAKFGPGRVLSGYRPRDYNARIGGATRSQHIYDDDPSTVAADLTFAQGTVRQWAAEARRIRSRLGYGGVGDYPRSGFVHIDNRRYEADWSG